MDVKNRTPARRALPRRVALVLTRCWRFLTDSAETLCPIPWRSLLRLALPLWLFTRLLALVVTYMSQTLLRASVIQAAPRGPITLANMLDDWRLWDGGFYGRILVHGYTRAQPVNAGFWPLYPLLAKPFEALLGASRWEVALLITSNLATLAAFVLIGALAVQEDETLGAARRAMTLLAAAPLALFLIGAYSDSLFLALACAALFTARRGQWRAAVLWTFLAALARPVGIALLAPLAWEYARQSGLMAMVATVITVRRRWRWRWRAWGVCRLLAARLVGLCLVIGAAPLAIGVFSLVCWLSYGDPLTWAHAERMYFMHTTMAPWSSLGYAWQQFWRFRPASFEQARVLVDAIPLVFALLMTLLALLALSALTVGRWLVWRGWQVRWARIVGIPATFVLYLLGLLLICLMSPIVGAQFPEAYVSVGRYLLAAIPLYLVIARLTKRYPWLETALIGSGFAVQALLMAFVLTGGWLV